MTYPVRPRQSYRIVTTNVEESAEVEVAVLEQDKAKDRIIRNVNQECMFRCTLLTSGNGQNVNAIDHIELSTYVSEAEIKKDGRRN